MKKTKSCHVNALLWCFNAVLWIINMIITPNTGNKLLTIVLCSIAALFYEITTITKNLHYKTIAVIISVIAVVSMFITI